MTNSTLNHWSIHYEARRRAIDRALLADCERQITAEEKTAKTAAIPGAVNPIPPVDRDEARKRIALAFGRPLR
jgi:hypothetical protein